MFSFWRSGGASDVASSAQRSSAGDLNLGEDFMAGLSLEGHDESVDLTDGDLNDPALLVRRDARPFCNTHRASCMR